MRMHEHFTGIPAADEMVAGVRLTVSAPHPQASAGLWYVGVIFDSAYARYELGSNAMEAFDRITVSRRYNFLWAGVVQRCRKAVPALEQACKDVLTEQEEV